MTMNTRQWIIAKVYKSAIKGIFRDKWGNSNMDQILYDIKK